MSIKFLQRLRGRPATAPVARERLQILLAHERVMRGHSDLLGLLREEILTAVARHVELDPDRVIVRMQRDESITTLEVDIELPHDTRRVEQNRLAG
jgi:cell division topological specificity factor